MLKIRKERPNIWRWYLAFGLFWFVFGLVWLTGYLEEGESSSLLFSISGFLLGVAWLVISFIIKPKQGKDEEIKVAEGPKIKLPRIIYIYLFFALSWFGISVVSLIKFVKSGEVYCLVFSPAYFLLGLGNLYIFWVMKTGRGSRRPHSREIIVVGDYQKIFNACIGILGKMKAKISLQDVDKGVIIAERGMSLTSFGEIISLRFENHNQEEILIEVESKLRLSVAFFQFTGGINAKNVNRFCDKLMNFKT